MAIAFFDFDETLIVGNSGHLWIRRELRAGHITPLQALQAGAWMFRYRLGFASLEDALQKAIGSLKGAPEQLIRERTRAFYEEEVRQLYRSGAREALEEHRRRGDEVVLLTASSLYLSELVAQDLGLDAVLCNRFEIDAAGLHTGRPVGEVCFGAGKLRHALAHAAERGVPLGLCTFYTDSYSDLPVLERVGRPVAVNPDRRLRRIAQQRGWEIARWGGPGAIQALAS